MLISSSCNWSVSSFGMGRPFPGPAIAISIYDSGSPSCASDNQIVGDFRDFHGKPTPKRGSFDQYGLTRFGDPSWILVHRIVSMLISSRPMVLLGSRGILGGGTMAQPCSLVERLHTQFKPILISVISVEG